MTTSREQILRGKIPALRAWRNESVDAKQGEYDAQAIEVQKLKKAYLESVAKLGKIKKEALAKLLLL